MSELVILIIFVPFCILILFLKPSLYLREYEAPPVEPLFSSQQEILIFVGIVLVFSLVLYRKGQSLQTLFKRVLQKQVITKPSTLKDESLSKKQNLLFLFFLVLAFFNSFISPFDILGIMPENYETTEQDLSLLNGVEFVLVTVVLFFTIVVSRSRIAIIIISLLFLFEGAQFLGTFTERYSAFWIAEKNRILWEENTPEKYTLTINSDYCSYKAKIHNGKIIDSQPKDGCNGEPRTIGQLYKQIAQSLTTELCGANGCLCDGRMEISVKYHPTLHYPMNISQKLRKSWKMDEWPSYNTYCTLAWLVFPSNYSIEIEIPTTSPDNETKLESSPGGTSTHTSR